jgi:hypothetical protein
MTVGVCSIEECANSADFFTLQSKRLLCRRHAADFGRMSLGTYYRVPTGMVLPQGPDEDEDEDDEGGDTLVPDDVLRQVGRALHEFHTATTMDPIEVAEELTRMEEAWDRLRPYLPPGTIQTPFD